MHKDDRMAIEDLLTDVQEGNCSLADAMHDLDVIYSRAAHAVESHMKVERHFAQPERMLVMSVLQCAIDHATYEHGPIPQTDADLRERLDALNLACAYELRDRIGEAVLAEYDRMVLAGAGITITQEG